MRPTVVLPLLLLASLPVKANQVHYRPVSLAELANRATHILVVRRLKPPSRTESVEITPRGEKADPAKYPPYRRAVYLFQVERALRLPKDEKLPKQIEVVSANDETDLELHRKYYLEKISKSPIYASYESPTSRKVGSAAVAILFLQRTRAKPPRYGYVVEGAAEPASEEARLKKALTAPTSKTP